MELDDALATLYEASPPEFVARRDAIVAELKRADQTPLAEQVHALRKPSLAAWALNLLARERPDELARLAQLGVDLRSAQSLLTGNLIRSLTAQRHQLVASVTKLACAAAAEHGHPLGPSATQEVSGTLTAALVSEEAARAVSSGLLTRALSYAGFGEVDVSEALAAPVREHATRQAGRSLTATAPALTSRPRESATAKTARAAADVAAAEQARHDLTQAEQTAAAADANLLAVRAREAELAERAANLAREIAQVRADQRTTEGDLASAAVALQDAQQQVKHARVALRRAEQRLPEGVQPK
ncbi:MAG TPA: hypothetical protein VFK66_09425 [Oryzihumus sp.]|nr:hypothetical protein [Oryzihumus sp.]